MPAAAEEPWAILAAIPDVVGYTKEKRIMPPGTDITVARNELPRVSVLTVSPHISFPACLGLYPYVAAADRSGLLLLCGTHPVTSTSARISYHICDARTGEVVSLPNPLHRMAFYYTNIGLIVKGDGCMVAGLQSVSDGTGGATLLSYKVGGCCTWREREITSSPPFPRDWYPEGVISHGGMLWWVDLSYGLLACDPFVEEPELLHIPLPEVLDELPADDRINRGARRCVKVSGGRLRYVQIHGDAGAPVVSTWALTEGGEWNPERRVPMAEVWINESYANTMLPLSIPALALLHPTNPDRVYFFLRSCIFAVDLRLRKLMEFNECEMRAPPRELLLKRSSRFVHAWQYDPSSNRSDFVSTCLRHEKAIAAVSSFSGIIHARRRIAKRVWDSVTRQQQEQQQEWRQKQQKLRKEDQRWRQQAFCHTFKRKCVISGES